ncbi:MAG: DUF5060 domain-containing protein, partial [Acidimicrobiia bacterium]
MAALLLPICVSEMSVPTASGTTQADARRDGESLAATSAAAERHPEAATVWRPVELTFEAAQTYDNPYTEGTMDATFTGPGGRHMVMPGFWDGGDTWRVRFAPPEAGIWRYVTSSPDEGLSGHRGIIDARPYQGSLDIYQHGFPKVSDNQRYFTHMDGTPFFWMGDVEASSMVSATRFDTSNDPRFESQFKGIVDTRAEQGFTVVSHAETFAVNNSETYSPGRAWLGVGEDEFMRKLDARFFQDVDRRVAYISDAGMVTLLANGVGFSLAGVDQV